MKHTFEILLAAVLLATSLSGCSIYKKYQRPESISTDNLFGENVVLTDTLTMADIGWRDLFTDPCLQSLVEQGLTNNSDMRIAAERITEAEAALRTARLAYVPTAAFDATYGTSGYTGGYASTQNYQLPFSASWEVDAAGRLWNGKYRALAAYEQSRIYRRSVQTRVIASIADAYYTLLMLDAQLAVSETTAASWKENVRIMRAMKDPGMTNEASVSQTEANSCAIDASLFDLRYRITQVENSLALLLGTTPQHFRRGKLADQHLSDRLMVGVPVQLLSRRPDVQHAEYALMQAFYTTNLARADFYPSISLGGSAGWINQFGHSIASPGALLFSFVGKLVQPIFAGGKLCANLRIAQAKQEQATVAFQQTLLQAGSEVNNALAQCQTARGKGDVRKRQIVALESAVQSTRALMSHSESTYLEVLTAQQTLLSAQLSQISDRFDEIQGIVNLYKALGGGAEEDASAAQPTLTPREQKKADRMADRAAKQEAKRAAQTARTAKTE